MKKKILALLICITMIICVACACSEDSSAIEQITTTDEMFFCVQTIGLPNSSNMYILVDNDTKVMYALTIAGGSYNRGTSSVTPLYNADGSLKLYED